MRLNLVYLKSRNPARAHQNENKVPFKELRPLVLKNYVHGGKSKFGDQKCLIEMSLLFGCWKKNQYDNNLCLQEIQSLDNCYKQFLQSKATEKKEKNVDLPSPTTKTYSIKQINHILRMYPNV